MQIALGVTAVVVKICKYVWNNIFFVNSGGSEVSRSRFWVLCSLFQASDALNFTEYFSKWVSKKWYPAAFKL